MPIDDIVNVTISRNTAAVSRAGFGVPLIMGLNRISNLIYEEYTDAASMITAGYKLTDEEYLAGLAIFSQNISPPKLAIGRRLVDVSSITTTGTITIGDVFTVTINGTAFSFTATDALNDTVIAAHR